MISICPRRNIVVHSLQRFLFGRFKTLDANSLLHNTHVLQPLSFRVSLVHTKRLNVVSCLLFGIEYLNGLCCVTNLIRLQVRHISFVFPDSRCPLQELLQITKWVTVPTPFKNDVYQQLTSAISFVYIVLCVELATTRAERTLYVGSEVTTSILISISLPCFIFRTSKRPL